MPKKMRKKWEKKKKFLTSKYLACEKWRCMKIQIVITRGGKRKKKQKQENREKKNAA